MIPIIAEDAKPLCVPELPVDCDDELVDGDGATDSTMPAGLGTRVLLLVGAIVGEVDEGTAEGLREGGNVSGGVIVAGGNAKVASEVGALDEGLRDGMLVGIVGNGVTVIDGCAEG